MFISFMPDMKENMKNRRIVFGVISLLFLIGIIMFLVVYGRKPSLREYQDTFGFSLSGLQVDYIDYYHEAAFQDPWSAYHVSLQGDTSGSVFDPHTMEHPLSVKLMQLIHQMNLEMRGKSKGFSLPEENTGALFYRILSHHNASGSYSYLYIIFDNNSQSYYVLWV